MQKKLDDILILIDAKSKQLEILKLEINKLKTQKAEILYNLKNPLILAIQKVFSFDITKTILEY